MRDVEDEVMDSLPRRCGTASGYSGHQQRGEKPCDACVRAKREYDARRNAAPDQVRKNRMFAKAQGLANKRLRHQHLDEYHKLYEKSLKEVFEKEDSP